MNVATGMGVCGWNIQHTNVTMGRRGGLSSCLDDCLLGEADQVKKDHRLQMDKLIKEIFPMSDLDHQIHDLLLASILRFWNAYVKDCDDHLTNGKASKNYIVKFMKRSCKNVKISYTKTFLKWASASATNFRAKNIAGIPCLTLDDLSSMDSIDGRNICSFLESMSSRMDVQNSEQIKVRSALKSASCLVKYSLQKQSLMENRIGHLESTIFNMQSLLHIFVKQQVSHDTIRSNRQFEIALTNNTKDILNFEQRQTNPQQIPNQSLHNIVAVDDCVIPAVSQEIVDGTITANNSDVTGSDDELEDPEYKNVSKDYMVWYDAKQYLESGKRCATKFFYSGIYTI